MNERRLATRTLVTVITVWSLALAPGAGCGASEDDADGIEDRHATIQAQSVELFCDCWEHWALGALPFESREQCVSVRSGDAPDPAVVQCEMSVPAADATLTQERARCTLEPARRRLECQRQTHCDERSVCHLRYDAEVADCPDDLAWRFAFNSCVDAAREQELRSRSDDGARDETDAGAERYVPDGACLEASPRPDGACKACECTPAAMGGCAEAVIGCLDHADPDYSTRCRALFECSIASGCDGAACYLSCMSEVEGAAGGDPVANCTESMPELSACAGYSALSVCSMDRCSSACR